MNKKLRELCWMLEHQVEQRKKAELENNPSEKNYRFFLQIRTECLASNIEKEVKKLVKKDMIKRAEHIIKLKETLKILRKDLSKMYYSDVNWGLKEHLKYYVPNGRKIEEALEDR